MTNKIKTGTTIPTISNLAKGQLGYCSSNKTLYINDNNNIIALKDVGIHYSHLDSLLENGRITKNLYCNNIDGDDNNDGLTPDTAVKSLLKLGKLQSYYNKFYVCKLYLKGSDLSYGHMTIGGAGELEGTNQPYFEQYINLGNYDGDITLGTVHLRGAEGHLQFFCENITDTHTILSIDQNGGGLINFSGCKSNITTYIQRFGRTNFGGDVTITNFQSLGGYITLNTSKFTIGPNSSYFRLFSGCYFSCGSALLDIQMANNNLVNGFYPIEIHGYLALESSIFSKNQIAYVGHGGFVNKNGRTVVGNPTFTELTSIQS